MALQKSRTGEFTKKAKPTLNLSDLLIPMISIVMFIVLTIFIYIPQFTKVSDNFAEIDDLKSQQSRLETNAAVIQNLENNDDLALDLAISQTVVPDELEVSDFTFYIDDLATSNGLLLEEINSSDISYGEIEDKVFPTGVVKGVTGPLRYRGDFDDITQFLEEIKVEAPFVVDTTDVGLRRYDTRDRGEYWVVDIGVTAFYIVDSEPTLKPTLKITPYTNEESLLLLMQSKALSDTATQAE